MELIRTIHPVGQGGFYSETLRENGKEVDVVYDCGGNNQIFMRNYLKGFIKPKMNIDIVFLSHFHRDHINGVTCLLKKANVKYLVIPQITKDIAIESFVYNFHRTGLLNNEIGDFILDIYDHEYYNGSHVIQILPDDDYRKDTIPIEDQHITEELLELSIVSIRDGTKKKVSKEMDTGTSFLFDKWFYIPYNPPLIPKKAGLGFYDSFKNKFNGGKDFELSELKDIIKKNNSKCKGFYDEYYKLNDFNHSSMLVFSGVMNPVIEKTLQKKFRCSKNCENQDCNCVEYPVNPNFLYTGDFDFNIQYDGKTGFELVKHYYKSFYSTLQEIQVSHHGSFSNQVAELYKGIKRGVVSYGEGNKFNHPHKETVNMILKSNCHLIRVTEQRCTKCERKYNI